MSKTIGEMPYEIPVSNTFPIIHITHEDLVSMSKTKMNVNPLIINGGIGISPSHTEKITLICYNGNIETNSYRYPYGYCPPSYGTIQSTHPDEKVIFISLNRTNSQRIGCAGFSDYKNEYVVITNFGNIFTTCNKYYRDDRGVVHGIDGPASFFKSPSSYAINDQKVEILPNVLEEDTLCRVPQIFVKIMVMMSQLLKNQNSNTSTKPSTEINLKDLCRQYNKDIKDTEDIINNLTRQLQITEESIGKSAIDLCLEFNKDRKEKEDIILKQKSIIEQKDLEIINLTEELEKQRIQMEKKLEEQRIQMEKKFEQQMKHKLEEQRIQMKEKHRQELSCYSKPEIRKIKTEIKLRKLQEQLEEQQIQLQEQEIRKIQTTLTLCTFQEREKKVGFNLINLN